MKYFVDEISKRAVIRMQTLLHVDATQAYTNLK